jgi:uncharacterized protein YprB with RNaseH-like and TPR domain
MLKNTFCHIPGVGEKTERRLWEAGLTSWVSPFERRAFGCPTLYRPTWNEHLLESLARYAERDVEYFAERLPASCHWRLYREFQDSCAFVDIETTGLPPFADITTAALFDGREVRWYVSGRNLDQFARDIQDYHLLVTFNGKTFDVPIIEGQLRVRLPRAHVDLRYVLRSLGLTGGLKACERALGLARTDVEGVDGFLAVLLWEEYRRTQNERALETLLAYNVQDVVTLQTLVVHAYNAKIRQTPFAETHTLPLRALPTTPLRADRSIVERLLEGREALYSSWGRCSPAG